MMLNTLGLYHFLSHKKTLIDFSGHLLTVIVGENGSGKSSIVDGITWGIFGVARGSGDDLIREGENECGVDTNFRIGWKTYKVSRTRERGKKTTLSLYHIYEAGSDCLNGATIAETQEKINALLGMDYDTFVNTACSEQGKTDNFTSLTPQSAKKLLMKILQLDVYETYKERAKEKVTTLANELWEVEGKLHATEQQLENRPPDGITEEELRKKIQKEEDIIVETIILIERQRVSEEKTLATLRETADKLGQLSGEISSLSELITKTEAKIKVVMGHPSECPLCKSRLDEIMYTGIIKNFQDVKASYEQRLDLQTLKRNQLYICQAELEDLTFRYRGDQQVNRRLCEEGTSRIAELRQQLGALTTRTDISSKLFVQKTELEADKAQRLTELNRYKMLVQAFSPDGIPALIVDNVLPEIEASANDILSQLSDGRFMVELSTQKELKKGGVAEGLEIKIKSLINPVSYGTIDSGGNYELKSGGEKFRVDLALRVALSRLLARRNNFRCATLIVDEGLGSLDADGRQRFTQVMENLKGEFERVICITHTEIADSFRNVLQVEKQQGESKAQWLQ